MIQNDLLHRERIIRMSAVIAILATCAVVILTVENMLLSFILAFVINYLLAPLADALERTGMTRSMAAACIYLAVAGIIGLCIWGLMPEIDQQIASIKNEFPHYLKEVNRLLADLEKALHAVLGVAIQPAAAKEGAWIMQAITGRLFQDLPGLISAALSAAVMAPLFAFFMLIDGRAAGKRLIAVVPNNIFETALNLHYQINAKIGGFIRARLLEAAIVGLIVFTGLLLIGYPYPFLLSVFAGLTNLVPYLGPIIGAVPAILLGLIGNGPEADLPLVMAVYATAQLLDAAFVVPLVVAKIVDLHAVIVIVVIIIGAQLGGILGMIISVPVAGIIKLGSITIYNHLIGFRT